MGRGRAKAIQKKIARDLKYSAAETDLDRLRAELAGGGGTADVLTREVEDAEEFAGISDDDEDE